MYRKHFALTRHPFRKDLSAEDLFMFAAAKEWSARLRYLLDLCGIGLLTGEPGGGKTTVTRGVVNQLHAGLFRVFYVALTTGNVMDLYKMIAWELGLPTERSRAALYSCIRNQVTKLSHESKIKPVLIIDEAHRLRSDVLEELRLLTNFQMDSENRLCLLLIGQAELRRRISMAAHEALSQRIIVRHHLAGLTRDELPPYLAHLLRLAGCEIQLFEPAAMEAIYQASNGLLRKVNSLAHHSLNAAALDRAKAVTAEHVQAAAPEVG